MKSMLKIASLFVFAALLSIDASFAQQRSGGNGLSPDALVSQTIFNTTTVTVTYGRPALKGRDLAGLAPADQVWRTGANEATTITFSTDVNFGGKEVPAGTYILFTIPGENWTFILNKQLTRGEGDDRPTWGAFSYDESDDLVRADAAVTVNNAPMMESFAIYFDAITDNAVQLNLHWGTTKTVLPITIN